MIILASTDERAFSAKKKTARGNEASDEVLGKLDNLTEQEFEMPAEVSEAVGQEE
ncbi:MULTISPECIES: hypothetical protein [unclassified Caballeronia]|uniref:hypothetical protein n=1 Tax=unclassified Caballeronia TaxID=2646786 RepID=UPI0028595F6D|nr:MULTISPECIES: hypothetical protein [unclassified Caballeronia]MDR5777446.1 DUF2795 domain-containing protein [Caballeronia sp. LZ002]MDR5852884.1 DUF2795 domain-containing protein [Caballeronia sp. LZ003]